MAIGSVIAAIALSGGASCAHVFESAVIASLGPRIVKSRKLQDEHWPEHLVRLANAACLTQNPDIIWQLASVESGFRFVLARTNNHNAPVIDEGKKAIKRATKIGRFDPSIKLRDRPNVDLGVMQLNWRYHADVIEHPMMALSPEGAVSIVSSQVIKEKLILCGEKRWLGCYHNANPIIMTKYERLVEFSRQKLVISLKKAFPLVLAALVGRHDNQSIGKVLATPLAKTNE